MLNKFNLSVDYFTETRNDIFVTRGTIPSEIGLVAGAKPIANLGKVRNGGVDLTLDYNQAINKDLIISAKGTFTYAKNKLLEKDEPIVDYPYLSDIGQPLKRYRGLVAIGLFEDEEDIANSPIQTYTAKVMPGDIKYADLNNDGKSTIWIRLSLVIRLSLRLYMVSEVLFNIKSGMPLFSSRELHRLLSS